MTIITRVTRECEKQKKGNQKEKKGFLEQPASKKETKAIQKQDPQGNDERMKKEKKLKSIDNLES